MKRLNTNTNANQLQVNQGNRKGGKPGKEISTEREIKMNSRERGFRLSEGKFYLYFQYFSNGDI
jgi:hypothetical protein